MYTRIKLNDVDREQWLRLRKNGIGGSDAGAIMGFNKYKSAYMVYLEKIGEYEADLSEKECVYWGNVLEDVVAKEFEKRTGKRVRKANSMFQSMKYPFMFANVDREIVGEKAILECKTTNQFMEKQWDGEEIPASYILQCQHYMAVTGYEKTYIACLIGGNKFIWKEIFRDNEIIKGIINCEKDFWQMVLEKNPPMIGGNETETEYINEKYANSNGEEINICKTDKILIEDFLKLQEMKSDTESKIEAIKNQIKENMKDSEIMSSDDYKVTWKNIFSKGVDGKKLKTDYPDVYNECLKDKKTRRFEIKEKK